MRYLALATDYDGTLATDGRVGAATLAALERARATGRQLVLVTGRELDDLQRVFPRLDLFDRVVAENGALLYRPGSHEEQRLGEPPPAAFVQALRQRGVTPLSVGRVIVATWHPQETTVLAVIQELGLELQVIFNKGAVMVLPPGVNKASGLHAALRELAISAHNTVAIGDAENDHAFLALCECAVAVANGLPQLRARADVVMRADHGAGVVELIDQLVADDLRAFAPRLTRHAIVLGAVAGGGELRFNPVETNLLLAGPSGSGKSTIATALLEQLITRGYQCCVVDPEGDFADLPGLVSLGDRERAPTVQEVLDVLAAPDQQIAVNLLGVPLEDRPAFFAGLLPRLQELRARTGRPHWLVVDEAHHLLPAAWAPAALMVPQDLTGLALITVHPDHLAPAILATVDTAIAVGAAPERTLHVVARRLGQQPPAPVAPLATTEALVWQRQASDGPVRVRVALPQGERRRHRRKYAAGALGPDKSFYFRGPRGQLNLRAQNLVLFTQLAAGVDDATWLYHLQRGDYSRWFREAIKDEELAAAAAAIEGRRDLSPADSRAQLAAAIAQRYTLSE